MSSMLSSSSRPAGVTLLAGYYMITGLIGATWNVLVSVFGVCTFCLIPGVLAGGVWGLITSVLYVILGASLWAGRDWSPLVVSVLAVIGIVTNVIAIVSTGAWAYPIFSIVVNVIVLLYMQSAEVKRFVASN